MNEQPEDATRTRSVDDLHSEIEALNEQVKILVRTEQQLYRTQNRMDRQLQQVQRLSDFVLSCSSDSGVTEILDRALELLTSTYDVHQATGVLLGGVEGIVRGLPPTEQGAADWEAFARAQPAVATAVRGLQRVALFEPGDTGEPESVLAGLCGFLGAGAGAGEVGTETTLAIIPIRGAGQSLDGFVALGKRDEGKTSFYREPLRRDQIPFLQIVGSHLERAIRNVILTQEASARNMQLITLNERLRESVSNLERTQGSLIQSGRLEAIGHLAGGVAHEFNNLLTTIISTAHLLSSENENEDDQEDLRQIIDAAEKGARLTSQLLDFSKRKSHEPELIDLDRGVSGILGMLEKILGSDIVVELALEEGSHWVRADIGQLEQVLVNLAVNARDAMPNGGPLSIRTDSVEVDESLGAELGVEPGSYVLLAMTDSGTGMDETTRLRVFEPFFTTKEVGKGSGMGLATAYGIVRQSGGAILVRSAPGQGSTFEVYLPASSGGAPRPAPEEKESPIPEVLARRILLVEDEQWIRNIAARLLRNRGYEVLAAADGHEALALVEGSDANVDLVLTDVIMPKMRGPELVQILRRRNERVRVLFMSGYSGGDLPDDVQEGGATRLLEKPFTPEELTDAVEEILTTP